VNPKLQPGIHPDPDQLSMFVEGRATAREYDRTFAHLAECADCRKAVFLMQPHAEMQQASATPVKGWIWRRLLPIALPAAALACALIVLLIYIRPRGGAPEVLQQTARLKQPEIQPPRTTAAPTISSERVTQAENPTNGAPRNKPLPNLSAQTEQAAGGLRLPEAKSHQMAANAATPQKTAIAPSVSVPVSGAAPPQSAIGSPTKSELPSNGRNVTNLQQLSTPADTKSPAANINAAGKEGLPTLTIERLNGQPVTLARVSGHITDRTGAVVVGATVTLRDASGKTRQTTTGMDGSFHLTDLPAGQYELTAAASGFETRKQSIELTPSELAMLQPVLDPAAVSEAVTVEAQSAAQQVQTESANLGGGRVVAGLPTVGGVIAVPSGLPVATTVSLGERFLSLDSAGDLFLSRNRGKKWKKVNPQWAGKPVRLELTTPASAGAAFQMTTDAGAVWTSKDGTHWHRQ
jgi:hypothetical protein